MLSAVPAYASPIQDKRARAEAVQRELDAFDAKLEAVIEDYNGASARYGSVTDKARANEARLASLTARIDTLQTSLGVRADSMYRTGPLGMMDVLVGTASFSDFATTWSELNQMNAQDASAVAELVGAREEAARVQAELEALRAEARAQQKALGERRARIGSEIETRKRMVAGLESEIAALQAEQARKASAALARWRASRKSTKKPSGGWDWGNPSRAPRSEVVNIAMRYLGRPYKWAASGPNAFDCSGLTSFVYAQVGVRLPRRSADQIRYGERVSRDNLQPGDLVFFGSPIHHVGIYAGGGMMVHSPRTGDVVKVSPLLRDYSGASRP